MSILTIAELQYGVTADDNIMEQHRRRRRVQDTLDRCEVLPFDLAATEYYGTLATLVRQHGHSPRGRRMDLMIAATAARYNLPLLTHNAEDFTGLDTAVSIIDPTN
ncbi:PIN domain-containing protein [Sciscionella marina]|uniref:PIN domain-containing protein n=1 Tax=Sciscionella marina TaxID=508770 RepID=UPI001F091016|nr:PIN domain-containing protein [Sciscionella marina]